MAVSSIRPACRDRRALGAAASGAALALALAGGSAAVPSVSARPALQAGALSYRLVDTWQHEPWRLEAGRYGLVADVSSGPDGTIFVLDAQNGAVHVLSADHAPLRAFHVPDAFGEGAQWSAERLDAGPDGRIYVLAASDFREEDQYRMRVDRLSPTGNLEHSFELRAPTPGAWDDIAVRPDGRIYLSRVGAGNPYIEWPGPSPTPLPDGTPNHAVQVFSRAGALLATLAPPELGAPGSLDFAADGTLYVINRVPTPWNQPPEDPGATPRPSDGHPTGASQEVEPIEGVLIFDPDHRVLETVRFSNGEDVGVGDAGVYVSRNVEIFALREDEPLWIGPTARIYAGYYGRIALSLDVHPGGSLLAGLNHCYFQGVAEFESPDRRPLTPRLAGRNDAPFLEGPAYPLRLGAAEQVAALQGRYYGSGFPPDRSYAASNYLVDPQTVQLWTRLGQPAGSSALRSQVGVCAGLDNWWVRDVAVDGSDVYTADPNLVQRRPNDLLPAWTTWPGAGLGGDANSSLKALDARDGTIVVLDAGAAAVHVLASDGSLVETWPLDAGDENSLPADIALGDERVYLADLGRSRIVVYDLHGHRLGEFATRDGPASIDVGPDQAVFVLGRGGWGFRHSPDGALEAMWPLPDRSFDALDLAVDVDGRVYVSWAETESMGPPTAGRAIVLFDILDAGIWVFEPTSVAPVPDPDPTGCTVQLYKAASPVRLPLGDETRVELQVDGYCPGRYDPVQVVVVLDSSRSMNFDRAIDRARDAVSVMLTRLDPRAAEVGLVTFEEGASLVLPLTRDIARVSASISAQDAWGDTRLAAGLALAHQELLPPNGDPAARRIILVVSDGVFNDDPQPAADAARADGLEILALILPTYEFTPDRQAALESLAGGSDRVVVDPDPGTLVAMIDQMIHYRRQTGLFANLAVDDVVPSNMRYVAGSAQPPALWSEAARTLTWSFENVAADRPVQTSYRLEPLEVGTWPTNVVATASFTDVLGMPGRLEFPVPSVTVYSLDQGATLYLPLCAAHSCFRGPKPIDLVLVLDTSSSMAERVGEPVEGSPVTTKLEAARNAAGTLLGLLRWPRDNAAVVSFDLTAAVRAPLTGDRTALQAALDGLATAEHTHIDLGLAEARRVLAARRWNATGAVVLLTDGLNNEGRAPVLAEAAALRSADVLVYTVGVGPDVDAELLSAVASSADGYYPSATGADLEAIYRRIASRLACDQP